MVILGRFLVICVLIGLESGYTSGRKTSHKAMAKVHVMAEERINHSIGVRGKREDGFYSGDTYLLIG